MKLLPLSRGLFAKVDDEDFEWLSQRKWYAKPERDEPGKFRAQCAKGAPGEPTYLSRILMNAPKGVIVDHKDRDRLNNQKENLRICTGTESAQNRGLFKSKTKSKYKGVRFFPKTNKLFPWIVRITVSKKRSYVGFYATEEEAAHAYDAAALKHFGEFACLNFPVVLQSNTLEAVAA